jgi:hypothetical protein
VRPLPDPGDRVRRPPTSGGPRGAWLGAVDGLRRSVRGRQTGDIPWQAWHWRSRRGVGPGFDLFYCFTLTSTRAGPALVSDALRRARRIHRRAFRDDRAARRGRHRLDAGVSYVGRIVAALLFYEHTLVRPGDLRRLDAAFFTMNGVISVAFFAFVLVDVL